MVGGDHEPSVAESSSNVISASERLHFSPPLPSAPAVADPKEVPST